MRTGIRSKSISILLLVLFFTSIFATKIALAQPTKLDLTVGLQEALHKHALVNLDVLERDSVGSLANRIYESRFKVIIALELDLFDYDRTEPDASGREQSFLKITNTKGSKITLYGVISSRKHMAGWKHSVAFDERPSKHHGGQPRNKFSQKSIITGSEQETIFLSKRKDERLREKSISAAGQDKNSYYSAIQQKVQRSWIKPPGAGDNFECVVEVIQIPGGEVVDARVNCTGGNRALQNSVEAAVQRASPLPTPKDSRLFERRLRFNFQPRN